MPVKNYQADLMVRLADPEYAALYLKTALDEALDDGDIEAFLLALKNIVAAKGPVQEAGSQTEFNPHLHQFLSEPGNPRLETLASVLSYVGLTIDFRPISRAVK